MRIIADLLMASVALGFAACAAGEADPDAQQTRSSGARASSPTPEEDSQQRAKDLVGTWDYQFDPTERQAILEDFSNLIGDAKRVTARLAFVNHRKWWLGFLFDGELFLLHGVPEGDGGRYEVDGGQLTTTGAGGQAIITYNWTLTGDRLTLVATEECDLYPGVEPSCTTDRADMDPLMLLITEHTFTHSGKDVTY